MDLKRILILSDPLDLHARSVAYAIRKKGHFCEEFSTHDMPTLSSMSLRQSGDGRGNNGYALRGRRDMSGMNLDFDTIWLRRVYQPWLPTNIHPGDRQVATRQCDRLKLDFLGSLGRDGKPFWVNDAERQRTAVLKAFQLREAVKAGLTVPETLISNDPQEIRAFIRECGGVAVHKVLQNSTWRTADKKRVFAAYTSRVTSEDLPPDDVLRLCPGIFQPLIEKKFEVRVACLGDYLVSIAIDSQADDRARLDWRAGQWYVPMEAHELPAEISYGIRQFLRAIGIAFAALDFIVVPNGGYIFLEANPQGQFMWMENTARVSLLDPFAEFLISGRRDFLPSRCAPTVTWAEFLEAWQGGLKQSMDEHVLPETTVTVPEDLPAPAL